MWRESSGALSAVPRKVLSRWNDSSVITRGPPEAGTEGKEGQLCL